MNKIELLTDLQSQSFVNRLIGDCDKVGMELGISVYQQCYLEVFDKCAQVKKVAFYVLNDGTEDEVAYYIVDQRPIASVQKLTSENVGV